MKCFIGIEKKLEDNTMFYMFYMFKCSWEYAVSPRAFENNSLCKIWGANKVYYGEFENRE